MLKRIKKLIKLWKLINQEPKAGEVIDEVVGNKKAVFLSDMTEEEVEKYILEEDRGWKKMFNKVRDILK